MFVMIIYTNAEKVFLCVVVFIYRLCLSGLSVVHFIFFHSHKYVCKLKRALRHGYTCVTSYYSNVFRALRTLRALLLHVNTVVPIWGGLISNVTSNPPKTDFRGQNCSAAFRRRRVSIVSRGQNPSDRFLNEMHHCCSSD